MGQSTSRVVCQEGVFQPVLDSGGVASHLHWRWLVWSVSASEVGACAYSLPALCLSVLTSVYGKASEFALVACSFVEYRSMQVQVDQSGKVNETNRPTALAMANGMDFSIRISAREKRKVVEELRRRRPGWKSKQIYLRMFATLLYLLLKDDIERMGRVIVDTEFSGAENQRDIKDWVLTLLRRQGIRVYRQQLVFQQIHRGKKEPPAHKLAWRVFKGYVKPDKIITAEDVLGEFSKK